MAVFNISLGITIKRLFVLDRGSLGVGYKCRLLCWHTSIHVGWILGYLPADKQTYTWLRWIFIYLCTPLRWMIPYTNIVPVYLLGIIFRNILVHWSLENSHSYRSQTLGGSIHCLSEIIIYWLLIHSNNDGKQLSTWLKVPCTISDSQLVSETPRLFCGQNLSFDKVTKF